MTAGALTLPGFGVHTKTYGRVEWVNAPRQGARGSWRVHAQPDVAVRLKRLFLVTPGRDGSLTLTATDATGRDLSWLLERWPMVVDPDARTELEAASARHDATVQHVTDILSGVAAHSVLRLAPAPEMTPRDYQRRGLDMALAGRGLLLADDLGTGKTLTTLLALSDPAMRPMLVVTLTGLPRQWLRELKKTFPTLSGHEVRKASPYDMTAPDGTTPDLIVMNYAKLSGWAQHLTGRVRSVVFDEVQELRRSGSQKHDAAAQVAASADLVVGASATPVYNFGGEMFSIMDVLRPGLLGTREEFAREWCTGTYGLDTKTPLRDPAAFRVWLTDQGAMLRRTRADVGMELPPVTVIEQPVDVDEKLAADGERGALEVARLILDENASTRDRWTASGEFDWKMRHATGVAKARFVADFTRMILESEEKVVLTGWHRTVWDIWRERLTDLNPVLYTGTESATQKAAAFDAFTEGDARILMLSLRSGAGLDGLQHINAQTIIFGELDWSPGVHKQVIGRLHRPGQQRPVAAYFCVTDYGADPHMLDVLNIKRIQSELLINPDAASGATATVEAPARHLRAMAQSLVGKHRAAGHRTPTHPLGPTT